MKTNEIPSTFLMPKINIIGCPFYASLSLKDENVSQETKAETREIQI